MKELALNIIDTIIEGFLLTCGGLLVLYGAGIIG